MSPEAYALAAQRVAIDLKEAARRFARALAQRQAEISARGMGRSSVMIMAGHELAREELEQRALITWAICRRIIDADDAEPSDETRDKIFALIRHAIGELSSDVESAYAKHREQMSGDWPSLEEPRIRALEIAQSEVEIDFLSRRRKRLPLGDVLRAPRYAPVLAHWTKARDAAESDTADTAGGLKEGILAVEALAKILVQGECATLGDCIKELRSRKLLDPGADKLVEGLWVYSSAKPGVRHGAAKIADLSQQDWRVLRPMLEAALTLLLSIDSNGAR